MNNIQSLYYFIPEFILVGTILGCILLDLFISKKDSRLVGYFLILGIFITFISFQIIPNDFTSSLFLNNLAVDPFSRFFKILILLCSFFIVLISNESRELNNIRLGEYYIILGIMIFGMFLLASAIDLLMIYLAIEIVSLMSFILAGYLKENKRSNESSLKYVIYGAFSSGLMLYGKKDELVPIEYITELNNRLSAQKGIKVEFNAISEANHFFSKTSDALIKHLDKYIKKETALY